MASRKCFEIDAIMTSCLVVVSECCALGWYAALSNTLLRSISEPPTCSESRVHSANVRQMYLQGA
jgi:hypothetical protein